jgi:ABC-type nitrate/sulfonate/bicarbonate transport system substrate-binding protein
LSQKFCHRFNTWSSKSKRLCVLLLLLTCFDTSEASEKATLQLAWKHQFQFAGYYAALQKGYYRQAGLDVIIVEGGEGKFAREEVLQDRAQYGVAGAELILHRKQGDPFVVLAPIFQHSASILLARKDQGIATIQDLIGKRVMLLPEDKDADILVAFMNEGISSEAFQRLDQSYNLNDLIEGRTDAVSAYSTNEPWHLLQQKIEPSIISPQTYGVDFYSDCLFTTQKEIERHPQRVKALLDASLLGWEYAMNHPEEIIDLLLTDYGVKKSRDHLRFEAEGIRKIMMPDLVEIGHMNPGRWRHILNTYAKLGLIEKDFSLDGFLYDPRSGVDYTWLKRLIMAMFPIVLLLFCSF